MVDSSLEFPFATIIPGRCHPSETPKGPNLKSLLSLVIGTGKGQPTITENLENYSTATEHHYKKLGPPPTHINKDQMKSLELTLSRCNERPQLLHEGDVREGREGQHFHPPRILVSPPITLLVETIWGA